MYAEELREQSIPLERLQLDPNNPRFWTEGGTPGVPEERIADAKVQSSTLEKIKAFGVDDLYDNILQNGFLPLDRIVVRQLADSDDYVVVEGNRRLAALRTLVDDIDTATVAEEFTEEYLAALVSSVREVDALVYLGGESDIAWILQGIRHISGIRDWEPAQRGRLVASQIDDEGLGFREAGKRFGLSAQAVGRLYRGYKALEQMSDDDEFGGRMGPRLFTLFEEAYRIPIVRNWLAWSEDLKQFTDEDHLRRFYAWITPSDETGTRRIHEPGNLKQLAELIESDRSDLMGKIDREELTIEDAAAQHRAENTNIDWRPALRQAKTAVKKLPAEALVAEKDEVLEFLDDLMDTLDSLRELLRT